MPRQLPPLNLSLSDREQIEQWLNAHGTPQQVVLRSRIVLAAADRQSDSMIARTLETNRKTVLLWRARFAEKGVQSLWEVAPGRGRKPTYGPDKIKEVIDATLQSKPEGMTHWSCRAMAKDQGVSNLDGEQHLAEPQSQTAPGEELQAVPGSALFGEADRRCGTVFESAPARAGAVCG